MHTKQTPYRNPPTKDISRDEAQRRAVAIFGPRAFARKTSKRCGPEFRRSLGICGRAPPFQVRVIGEGRTWQEATENAIKYVERFPEVLS